MASFTPVFYLDMSEFCTWQPPDADLPLNSIGMQALHLGVWNKIVFTYRKQGACRTIAALNGFCQSILSNAEWSKCLRVTVSTTSGSVLQVAANSAACEKYFQSWGVLPADQELDDLMAAAAEEDTMLLTDGRLGKAAQRGNIGDSWSVSPMSIGNACHYNERVCAWLPGEGICDIPSASASVITAPMGSTITALTSTTTWKEAVDSVREMKVSTVCRKQNHREQLLLSVPCHLVLDEAATPVNWRLLTPAVLQRLRILSMPPSSWDTWMRETGASEVDASECGREQRIELAKAQDNPSLRVNPAFLLFRTLTFASNASRQHPIPHANWLFLMQCNSDAFLRRGISSRAYGELQALCNREISAFKLLHNYSWIMGADRRLHIQIAFSTALDLERKAAPRESSSTSDLHLAQHGLKVDAAGTVTKSGFWLRALKQGNSVVLAEHLLQAVEGFHRESAEELLADAPPVCSVCAENKCDTLLDTCGHSFCNACLVQMCALDVALQCPACRAPFANKQWSVVRKQATRRFNSTFSLELSRKAQLVDLVKRISADESVALLAIEECVAKQVRTWMPTVNVISLEVESSAGAGSSAAASKQYDTVVACFSSPKVSKCKAATPKVYEAIQRLSHAATRIVIPAEVGTRQEALALEFQQELASMFDGCTASSCYSAVAEGEDVEIDDK